MSIRRLYNVADVRDRARRRLPKGIFEFIDRGTEDDLAMRRNRAAFEQLQLRPQVGVDVSARHTRTQLFGREMSLPLAIAPTGAAGLVWYRGELELAKAAATAGIPFTLATRSMTAVEDIAAQAKGRLWFQLYMWTERELSYGLVERAQRAGCEALIVTLDVPVAPNREYNLRNGFSLPFRLGARSMFDMLRRPRWLSGVMGRYLATTGMPRYENQPGRHRNRLTQGDAAAPLRSDAITWDDVRELRRRWQGPLLVKGILRVDDALRAVAAGADGVIVSNHGGRCLDCSVAPLEALPRIADTLAGRATVLLDSGIRRGSDIAKALTLGAAAVLSGRPTLYGMAAAGQAGARHVIGLLQAELLTTLGMLGCTGVHELGPHLLQEEPAAIEHLLAQLDASTGAGSAAPGAGVEKNSLKGLVS